MRAYIVPIDIIGQTPVEEKRVSVPTILLAELLICFGKLQLLYNIFPIIVIHVSKSHWNWNLGLPNWNPLSCLSHASQRSFTSIKLHIGLSGFPFSSVSIVELESDCKPWNHIKSTLPLGQLSFILIWACRSPPDPNYHQLKPVQYYVCSELVLHHLESWELRLATCVGIEFTCWGPYSSSHIIELVDSVCRDSVDTQYILQKNLSKMVNL